MKKRRMPVDMNLLGKAIVDLASSEKKELRNPHAEAGRLGGLKGGKARAAKLSKKRKQEIAKKAIEARWKDVKAARGTSPSPIYFFIDVPCLF